jgi:hypothetical protein
MSYVPLALSFGVTMDRDVIERVLARRNALQPLGSPDLTIARMSLATHQENAEKAADSFSRHATWSCGTSIGQQPLQSKSTS